MATMTFNIFFEEIWDFYITFQDWKTSSLQKDEDKQMTINPSLQLTLITHQALENTAESQTLKNEKMPHWG